MDAVFSILKGAFAIIVTFGLAVTVHEMGHMLFALWRGVGVEEFALGMGPKICARRRRGIVFSLRWLPVGGFVKLKGMIGEETTDDAPEAPASASEKPSLVESSYADALALSEQGFVTKFLVFGGGVFMNFVTAIAATAFLLWLGTSVPVTSLRIETVRPDSSAAATGLRAGDRIVSFDGEPTQYVHDFFSALTARFPETAIGSETPRDYVLGVERVDGERMDLTVSLTSVESFERWFEGVDLWRPAVIGSVSPNQPADKAGIEAGDRVVAIDGAPVASFSEMARVVKASDGRTLTFTIERDGERTEIAVTPTEILGARMSDREIYTYTGIGIASGAEAHRVVREANPLRALAAAPGHVVQRLGGLLMLNVNFFRKASLKQVGRNVGGPIAIAAMTARFADEGLSSAIDWFITLNLILLIMNLLPIPVLDGGFLLLAVIEGVIRRPVPEKILTPIYTVFTFALIGLIALISLMDVLNWLC